MSTNNQDIDTEIDKIGRQIDHLGKEMDIAESETSRGVDMMMAQINNSAKIIEDGAKKLDEIDNEAEKDIDNLTTKQASMYE